MASTTYQNLVPGQVIVRSTDLETAMNDVMNYSTGFTKDTIKKVDKQSCIKGVCMVLDTLFDAYEGDEELKNNTDFIPKIFNLPHSSERLEGFITGLSRDLGCPHYDWNKKTLIEDMKGMSSDLKQRYDISSVENLDFNSFMSGVRRVVGPVQKTYDELTGKNLKNSNNWFAKGVGYVVGFVADFASNAMHLDEKAQPIVDKLSSEINALYRENSV
ncbi:MAG: hypothetical protein JW791_03475 [Nanoarchaeota archaeon]|nr:hypothetical protein [Nanoarchaeota archaeon]